MRTVKHTTIREEAVEPEPANDPKIVAYRMGQLEKRFDKFDSKIDNLTNNFATIVYVDKAIQSARGEFSVGFKLNDERVKKIETNISRLVWLVLSTVIIALLDLVIRGGIPT